MQLILFYDTNSQVRAFCCASVCVCVCVEVNKPEMLQSSMKKNKY